MQETQVNAVNTGHVEQFIVKIQEQNYILKFEVYRGMCKVLAKNEINGLHFRWSG